MPNIILNVTEGEQRAMERYARAQGVDLAVAIKEAFLQLLEDEYDRQLIAEHREKVARGEVRFYTHEEVVRELGLDDGV